MIYNNNLKWIFAYVPLSSDTQIHGYMPKMDDEDEKSILLEEKVDEAVVKPKAFPKSVAFIIGNEFCER